MSIELELRALDVEFPRDPELEARVLVRIERPRRRWLVPALAAVASLGALFAIPQTRAAILDFLEIGDVRVERVETQPRAPSAAPQLGRPVTVDEAQAAVDFPLLVPARGADVFLDPSVRGGMVNLRFGDLVLSEWRGLQLPYVEKQVGPGSDAEELSVDGAPGVWIDGAEHVIAYRDADGIHYKERRLAGNVLIWERGGITYRLENASTREEALALARELRPR